MKNIHLEKKGMGNGAEEIVFDDFKARLELQRIEIVKHLHTYTNDEVRDIVLGEDDLIEIYLKELGRDRSQMNYDGSIELEQLCDLQTEMLNNLLNVDYHFFHTSPNKIEKIHSDGALGECLCFSSDPYRMSGAPCITYRMDFSDNEIIEARTFFYRDDCNLLDSLVIEVMSLVKCDEDTAQDLLSQRDRNDINLDGEISWKIQGYTGQAAKILGYKAAMANDEQGAVYIVPMRGLESELIEVECDHSWSHHYNFARCALCGDIRDIPTISDHKNDI